MKIIKTTAKRMKMKIGPWKRRQINRNRLQKTEEVEEDAVTLPETPEKEVEADAGDVKEAVPALVLNDKSAMPMQAFEVVKEEAAGMEVSPGFSSLARTN